MTCHWSFGVPHMATEEDEYEGHTIPAGAIMTPDVWYDNIESNMYFR